MIDGRLFTRDFLLQGIRETANWKDVDNVAFVAWTSRAKGMLDSIAARNQANEAETEADKVYPLLAPLDWKDRDPQPNLSIKRRDLCMLYLNALSAGDPDSHISLPSARGYH